jgi:rhamnogalacturonyl hydrolase YesR
VDINHSLNKLRQFIEQEDFKGYDPYDALNSPIVRFLSFSQTYLRIGFIQALKKAPLNLRPLLLINKGHNPKGLGLFLWGYAKLYQIEKRPEYLEKIRYLLGLLNSLKNSGYSGHCWGYNFDWQSRAFFLPKYTPTVVNSSFIGYALLDAYEHTGMKEALELAIPIKDFILNDLNRYEENGAICFSYSPLDDYFVHNANLFGASFLMRVFGHNGEKELKNTALNSLAYSMNHQREDGSWFYAEKEGAHWIDSFHTGFNLQAIKYFMDLDYGEEYRSQFNRGVKFYAQHFFLEDGTPKYFHDRVYPIDIHCPAQAVLFFSGMGVEYQALTDRIMNWMLANMQDRAGYFYFQKHQYYTNRIPYMRWGQAWAFHALTQYYLNKQNEPGH